MAEDETEAASVGRVAEGPGGVFESGTQQEDGPVTWEAPMLPRTENGTREPASRDVSGVSALKDGTLKTDKKSRPLRGRPRRGEPEPRSKGVGESEDRI